jgi:uncharacterized protein YdeI (BOF family)
MRKLIIPILIVIAIAVGGAAWYYFSQIRHPSIETILSNPRAYEGKAVTIEGEVTERTSFFVVAKFYKLRDKTGEIVVVTKRTLPEVRSKVSVKGKIDDAFAIGDQKLLVFAEESVEEKGRNK